MKREMRTRMYVTVWLAATLMFALPAAAMAYWEEYIVGTHTEGADAVVYFQDGVRLASGGSDFKVKIWDVQTGTKLFAKQKHTGAVTALALSADNKILASAGLDELIILWDTETMSVLSMKTVSVTINAMAFAPDGTLATAGNDGVIRLYALNSGKLKGVKALKKHTAAVESVAFSADGHYLASGSRDYTVRVFDVSLGAANVVGIKAFKTHTAEVTEVAFFPDGRLVSAGNDRTVRMYDLETLSQVAVGVIPWESWFLGYDSMAVSPDGTWIAAGGDDTSTVVWFQRTGDKLRCVAEVSEGNGDDTLSLSFSPDSSELASASADGTVKVIPTGETIPLY